MNVNPGELRHRISFVTETNGYDDNGFPIQEEVVKYSCYARVTNTSGTEQIKSGVELAEVKTRFLIRYTDKIQEDYQIKFNDNYYDIKYINDYQFKHEYKEVWAELQKQV